MKIVDRQIAYQTDDDDDDDDEHLFSIIRLVGRLGFRSKG